jgi:hypothetical protein
VINLNLFKLFSDCKVKDEEVDDSNDSAFLLDFIVVDIIIYNLNSRNGFIEWYCSSLLSDSKSHYNYGV